MLNRDLDAQSRCVVARLLPHGETLSGTGPPRQRHSDCDGPSGNPSSSGTVSNQVVAALFISIVGVLGIFAAVGAVWMFDVMLG